MKYNDQNPYEQIDYTHYYAVIMAGGGGTRLWPLSRRSRPKQLLSLFDSSVHRDGTECEQCSLFQMSVRRLRGIFPPQRIFVIAVPDLARDLRAQAPEIPAENFLHEPAAHNTAPVVGLGAAVLHQRDPQAVMAVLTADHFIANEELFRQYLLSAYDLAQAGYLVTLGIEPTFPSTGFGYIQRGEHLGDYRRRPAYQALRFKEKPDAPTAIQMLKSGDHAWNSGMFFWRVDRILAEFARQLPELAHGLDQIERAWGTAEQETTLQSIWPSTPKTSIDFGIMENAAQVAVLPAGGLGWSDVGSWDSLFDILDHDADDNAIMHKAGVIPIDTHNSLIYTNQNQRLVVAIGVDDLVLVDVGDVLLVCRKDHAQRVRQVVEHLKSEGSQYL